MKTGIHYKEIEAIIISLSDSQGYIPKEKLQQRIDQLSESVIPKNTPLVNNRMIIINNIIKFQHKAKLKGYESSYKKFIKNELIKLGFENVNLSDVKLVIHGTNLLKLRFKYGDKDDKPYELLEYNFIHSLNELTEILDVSRPTINRWGKLGFYTKLNMDAHLIIKGEYFRPFYHVTYYDLGYIKHYLRELR